MKKVTIHIQHNLAENVPTDILKKGGCYILFSKQWEEGISRFNGKDSKAILYIGKADTIASRVKSLQKSVLSNSNHDQDSFIEKGHKSLSRKFFRIRKFIDSDFLYIDIIPLKNEIDPKVLESYLLEKYVAKFGELPPLNGQYGSYSLNEARIILEE